jgi:hypothetical protein
MAGLSEVSPIVVKYVILIICWVLFGLMFAIRNKFYRPAAIVVFGILSILSFAFVIGFQNTKCTNDDHLAGDIHPTYKVLIGLVGGATPIIMGVGTGVGTVVKGKPAILVVFVAISLLVINSVILFVTDDSGGKGNSICTTSRSPVESPTDI